MASESSTSVLFTKKSCYTCFADLSKLPKNRVIIRNRKTEYSALYSIVIDLLKRDVAFIVRVCLSYPATLQMMDVIVEGFDQEVLGWREMLLSRVTLPLSQVHADCHAMIV